MPTTDHSTPLPSVNRRQFLGGALGITAVASLMAPGAEEKPAADLTRKIKLGVIGNGGRGRWIAGLFKQHGGYDMHA